MIFHVYYYMNPIRYDKLKAPNELTSESKEKEESIEKFFKNDKTPITDEYVSKVLLKFYESKQSEALPVLRRIKKSILQKCYRTFLKCCKLLFPDEQEKQVKETKKNNSNDSENKKIMSTNNQTNDRKELSSEVNSKTNTKKVNSSKVSDDYDNDDDDDEEEDNYTNKLSNKKTKYLYQQLLDELYGII